VPKVVDHEARRLDFIEAAFKTIVEDGLENTTVRAVAKNAGYSTGALVHYFGDKDELILQALQHAGNEMRKHLNHFRETLAKGKSTGKEALRAVLLEVLPTNAYKRSSWKIWIGLWYRSENSPEMKVHQKFLYEEWLSRISNLLLDSIQRGEIGADLEVQKEAEAIIAYIDGIGVQSLLSPDTFTCEHQTILVDNYIDRIYLS